MKQHPAHVCSIEFYSAALSPGSELMGSLGQDERKGKRRKPNLFNVVEKKTRKLGRALKNKWGLSVQV